MSKIPGSMYTYNPNFTGSEHLILDNDDYKIYFVECFKSYFNIHCIRCNNTVPHFRLHPCSLCKVPIPSNLLTLSKFL